jgi:hypothetical protein
MKLQQLMALVDAQIAAAFATAADLLTAYSWHHPGPDGPAIDLAHDFQQVENLPENDRARYAITPQARKDLLTRLLKTQPPTRRRGEYSGEYFNFKHKAPAPRKSRKQSKPIDVL